MSRGRRGMGKRGRGMGRGLSFRPPVPFTHGRFRASLFRGPTAHPLTLPPYITRWQCEFVPSCSHGENGDAVSSRMLQLILLFLKGGRESSEAWSLVRSSQVSSLPQNIGAFRVTRLCPPHLLPLLRFSCLSPSLLSSKAPHPHPLSLFVGPERRRGPQPMQEPVGRKWV